MTVVDFLRQPTAYPEVTRDVQLVETHISWVFLTDQFVYKLKKPVRFEFLDFSELSRREQACRDELRLNRRLTRDVYLDVLPITRDREGSLEIGGDGEVVDWVVKMTRLASDRSMDRLIESGTLQPEDVDALTQLLVRFYSEAEPIRLHTETYLKQFEQHIRANWEELADTSYAFETDLINRIHSAQLRYLLLAEQIFRDRIDEGRVTDGHGDLRPEHVYFADVPQIIDCIEFNAEFRTVDVVDELAFLTMECDRLAASWVGQQITLNYRSATNDSFLPSLMSFFKAYRACVRCKVTALRWKQMPAGSGQKLLDDCHSYLELANRYVSDLGPPVLILVRGLSGSGKSTIARRLASRLGGVHLQTDQIRRQIQADVRQESGFNQGAYSESNRLAVYQEMLSRAEHQLQNGMSVVLDGTFLAAELRERAMQLAMEQSALPLIVRCTVPDAIARERIQARSSGDKSLSDAKPEFVQEQKKAQQPDHPDWPAFEVDTAGEIEAAVHAVLDKLREMNPL